MNGYETLADACKRLLEQGDLSEKEESYVRRQLRIYQFLATCDEADRGILFDSGAFNDYVIRFVKTAMQQAGVSEQERQQSIAELEQLFADYHAEDL